MMPVSENADLTFADELSELLGNDRVSVDAGTLEEHSTDKWFASHSPEVVVFAESTEDVSKLLRFCHEREIPVTPRGAGVGYVGGCVPLGGGVALSLARMNRILEIHETDGVAVVQPGVITGELQAAVREKGMMYPPDPASLKECSLGGNIATNAGGPRCLKYGVTRHYVLGLEVVLADGSVMRTGGRCHKNKTGFDLIGMFVGSEGMLGIVTEAILRLIPHPETRSTISTSFEKFTEAAAAVQAVLGSGFHPAALEIADKFTLEAARSYLGEGVVPRGEAHLMIELDGHKDSVASESAQLIALLKKQGALSIQLADTEESCEHLWGLRREFSYSLRATGLTKLNEDVVVPRGRLVDLVQFAEKLQDECGMPIACFGHAGDGNIHVNIMVKDIEDPAVRSRSDELLDRLFKQVLAWDGVISGEHGIGIAKKRWFSEAIDDAAMDVHLRLKDSLDPRGILNPGKFLAEK
ncbi:MAG: glycolate oxidase [Verrucomicrobiales bacterium]|jgi:glycolate oxidase